MKMEHRLSTRKPIAVDVSMYYPPVGLISGRTRNISLAGMFVETQGVELPKSASLEVAFVVKDRDEPRLQRVRAMVARIADDGIGLMFDSFKYSSYCALQGMLNAA